MFGGSSREMGVDGDGDVDKQYVRTKELNGEFHELRLELEGLMKKKKKDSKELGKRKRQLQGLFVIISTFTWGEMLCIAGRIV